MNIIISCILVTILGLTFGFYCGGKYFKNKISSKNVVEHRLQIPDSNPSSSQPDPLIQKPIPDKQLDFELAIRKIYIMSEKPDPQNYLVWSLFKDILLKPGDNPSQDGTASTDLFKFSWSYEEEYLKIESISRDTQDFSQAVLGYWTTTQDPQDFKVTLIPPRPGGTLTPPLEKEGTYYPDGKYFILSFKEVDFKLDKVYVYFWTKN